MTLGNHSIRRRFTCTLAVAALAGSLVACQSDKKPYGSVPKGETKPPTAASAPAPTPTDAEARQRALDKLTAAAASKNQPGQSSPPAPPKGTTAPGTTKPNTTAPTETAACTDQYKRIRKVFDALPEKFYNADPGLSMRVDAGIKECRSYLTGCLTAPQPKAEVQAMLGKFLFTMSAVRKAEWQTALGAQYKGRELAERVNAMNHRYMGEVVKLTTAATQALPKESQLRGRALMILGQAATQSKTHDQAIQAYDTFVKDFKGEKDLEERARAVAGLAAAYREAGEFDLGIALIEGSLKELYNTRIYPFLLDGLYKLQLAKGDLAGMLQASKTVITVLPLKLETTSFTDRERQSIESLVVFHGFRRGYAQFAMGDMEEARKSFGQHIESVNAKEAKLTRSGQGLPPAWKIYRDRSMSNLAFLDELAERPAPHDLDLGSSWVSKGRSLPESRGQVSALLFRRVGDERSAPFLEEVHQICAADPTLDMSTVAFIRSEATIAQEFDEMRQELQELGYEGAAGFDPDFANKTAFRSFHAMIGSATFVIVDATGNLAWFQQDPRRQDVNFAKSILKRIASGG